MKLLVKKKNAKSIAFIIIAFLLGLNSVYGQRETIQGTITDFQNESPIPFASVTLYTKIDSTMLKGTVSNEQGRFEIASVSSGDYFLSVSFIGYRNQMHDVNLANGASYDIGTIKLMQKATNIDETLVVADRIKTKSTNEKTTFFVNKKMYDVSNTGVDMLKQLPGVHVDLMQNVSLEGSRNIIIFVNGKERDVDFVQQISADQIDKIEVVSSPGAKYDANITGVLNIVLKERDFGISGHVNVQTPITDKQILLNPSYSLSYGNKRFNIYTSYNGELNYFDITERNIRELNGLSGFRTFRSDMDLRQKSWKHRFHYGVDFFMNEKNQFSFYGFYNPYSQEFDGNISMQSRLNGLGDELAQARREETDKNHQAYYSLYYKHLFGAKGGELTVDLNYYNLKTDNTVLYDYHQNSNAGFNDVINTQKPIQHLTSLKIDYTSPLYKDLRIYAGIKSYLRKMKQHDLPLFYYNQNSNAAYFTLCYSTARLQVSSGLRVENYAIEQNQASRYKSFALLPNARINMQINKKHKLQFNYRQTIQQANIYQINPAVSVIDPYTIQRGNSMLQPAYKHRFSLDYILLPGNNYISTQLFYSKITDAIQNLSFINDQELLETRIENLGEVHQYGIKWSGAIKLGHSIGFSPYFKLFRTHNNPNNLAKQYLVSKKEAWAYESGFSASVSFKNQIATSVIFQYNSPIYDLQNKRYSDVLYFISVDKTLKKGLKIGISTAIPFVKTFNYSGMETKGPNFYSSTKSDINISALPIGLHVRYQFNKGKKVKTIDRDKAAADNINKKGF